MELRYVARDKMPDGHEWAVIEDGAGVTILAIDAFAAKLARTVAERLTATAN